MIDKGRAKNNRECPIALSLYRSEKVGHATIYDNFSRLFMKRKIKGKTIVLDFFHSDQILKFITKFDKGETVNPQIIKFSKDLLGRKILV